MSDEEKIQIAALGLLGILGRKPKRSQSPSPVSPQRSPGPQDSDNDEDGQPRNSGIPSGSPTPDETDREIAERLQRDANDDLLKRKTGQPRKRRGAPDILTGIPTPDETDRERDERPEAERQQKNREREPKVEAYREAFSKYDTDRSGSISLSELGEGYKRAGMDFQAALEAMGAHDLDGNGNLSFEEFLKWGLDTNALEQWGRNFETAKMPQNAQEITPVPPRTVAGVDDMLKKAGRAKQKGASSGAKPAGKGEDVKRKNMAEVETYLKVNGLLNDAGYTQLTKPNQKKWETAVDHFETKKPMALIYLFRSFMNAATGGVKKKYTQQDLKNILGDAAFDTYVSQNLVARKDLTKILPSGGPMAPLIKGLIKALRDGVKFKQYVPKGKPKPSDKVMQKKAGDKTRKKKGAAGVESKSTSTFLNKWLGQSSTDSSGSSSPSSSSGVEEEGGEDGDKTPEQGTTDSSSSGDEAEEEQILLDSKGNPFQTIALGFLAVRRQYKGDMKDKLFRVSNSGGDKIYKVLKVRTYGTSKPRLTLNDDYIFVRNYESSEDAADDISKSVTEFAPQLRF